MEGNDQEETTPPIQNKTPKEKVDDEQKLDIRKEAVEAVEAGNDDVVEKGPAAAPKDDGEDIVTTTTTNVDVNTEVDEPMEASSTLTEKENPSNINKDSTKSTNEDHLITQTQTVVVPEEKEDSTMEDKDKDKDKDEDDHKDNDIEMQDTIAKAQQTSRKLNEQALLQQMESNYISVKTERDSLRTLSQTQSDQLSKLQTTVLEMQQQLHDQTSQTTQQALTAQTYQQEKDHACEQTRLHKEQLDQLRMELDHVQAEKITLANQSQKLHSDIHHLTTSNQETASSAIPLRYEKERLQTQLENLTSHSHWLETELQTRTQELTTHQNLHSTQSISSKQEIQALLSQKEQLEILQTQLEQDKQQLFLQVEQLHSEKKDQTHLHTDAITSMEEELYAEQRVSKLLDEKSFRLEDTITHLQQTVEEYKQLASKAVEEEEERQSQLLRTAQTGMETQLQKVRRLEDQLQEMTHQKTLAEKALQDKHAAEIRRRKLLHEKMAAHQHLTITDGSSSSPMEIEPEKQSISDKSLLPTIATPISLTDLYARLAETEDELNTSQTENARLQLYLQKICAEMEGSAPKIRQQQVEYRMALKERDQSQNRLEEAVREADSAHREAEDLAEELVVYSKEVKELRVENQDLASQVQILLESRVSEDRKKDGATDLVGFTNVPELQEQNQRLLKEHHTLSQRVKELTEKLDQSSLQASLDAAEEELNELQEERTRQTTLVAGIVQQRDLYRALLAKTDQTLLLESDEAPKLLTAKAHESPRKKITAEDVEETTKLKADVFTANNTIAALEERVKRLDAHSTNLMESMDTLSQQLTTANATIARGEAEATYHSEKCFRLEESVLALQNQVSMGEKRVADVQNVNADLQKAIAEARTDSSRYGLDLKHVNAKNNLLETQLKTAQAAEARLVNETKNLQSELSRRGALLDSVQRIEASLSARSAQEMQVMEEEIKQLKESAKVTDIRQISAQEDANDKISSLELNVISLQKDKETAMELSVKAKDMSLGLQKQVKFLENKTNQLEKELEEKIEKLKELEPETPQTVDANKEKIAELTAKLQTVGKELALTKERAATFQEIAKKTETDLADLTKVTDQFKKEKLEEIETLKSDLNSSKKDADAKQVALTDLGKDLENQRNEEKESESKLKTRISSLENDVDNLKKDSSSSKERLSALKVEVDFHRDTAMTEQKNYERELELHSAARSELRSVRSNLDVEQSRRESNEGELKALQFEYEEQKKAWSEEKSKLEDTMKEMDERLDKSREQNNLLHSQMNDLTASVEKFQASRIEIAAQDEGEGEGEKSSTSEESEIAKLEKSVSELRGMVRYMKSEREIVDAQLDTLRRAVERERATSGIAKRNLDEARVELELLQKRTVSDTGGLNDPTLEANKENENILQKSEEQTTLLRESNALLREESERMRAKLQLTQISLEDLKESIEPSQWKVRELEVDLAAASSEKSSLKKELEAWKSRMQKFVSKFQMIDPEEHEKALKLAEKVKKELQNMKNLKENADQASTNAKAIISRLNRENSLQKTSIKEINTKLVKATAEKDTALKSQASSGAALKKERDELKKKVEELDSKLKTIKPEHVAVKGRVDNLTKMLKQYKSKMLDLNKQHQASLAKEKETQKALVKEQELLKEKTAALDRASIKETAKSGADTKQVEDSKTSADPPITGETKDKATIVAPPNVSEKKETVPKPAVEVPPGGFKFAPSPNVKTSVSIKKVTGAVSSEKPKESTSIPVSKKPRLVKVGKTVAGGKPASDQKVDATSSATKETLTSSSADKAKETAKKILPAQKSKIIKLGQSSIAGSKSVVKSVTSVLSEPKPEADSKQTTPSKIPAVPDMNSLRAKLMERKRKLNMLVAAAESKKKKDEVPKEIPNSNPATVDQAAQKLVFGSSSKVVNKAGGSQTPAPAAATLAPAPSPAQKSFFESSAKTNPTTIAAIPSTQKPVFGSLSTTIGKVEAKKDVATMNATPIAAAKPAQKSFFASPAAAPGKADTNKGQLSDNKSLQTTKSSFGFSNSSSSTPAFGSSSKAPTFGSSFGQSTMKPASSSGGDGFLNLKPPGSSSSSAPFTFGSSASITLPVPSKQTVTAPKMPFGVFGQTNAPSTSAAFGGTAGTTSLFGSAGTKRSATSVEGSQPPASKQPRAEVSKEDGKSGKEEGEEKE